ncbi:DUF488 domain-containing protein [Singulisphaera sp. Ch08]|uniref:DUF488 domain-containing protein n=1 Tax=Singulisphaera sp. Ch08 TaxID=3120278 RepID=A0AAU7CQV9_9BACT
MTREIWTIGHSTRGIGDFVGLLEAWSIDLVADVRRFPGSKRYPQFNRDALAAELTRAQINYRHFGSLGGRRHERKLNSPNTGWRVEAFNAYADFMSTGEFQDGLITLIAAAGTMRTAVMCSEAVPWRCHRRLIADALTVAGWTVWDILGAKQAEPHRLTEFARISERG